MDFGSANFALNKGWSVSPLVASAFRGFTPLFETSSETQVTSMLNTAVADYIAAGLTPPTLLNINAGAGGRSIFQLMTSASDIYPSLSAALAAVQAGHEFAVTAANNTYDFYVRTAGGAQFYRNIDGPLPFFDNMAQQIVLAVQYATAQGYDVSPSVVFNYEQGQADNQGDVYGGLLAELVQRVEDVARGALGPAASVEAMISQVRGYSNKDISINQLQYVIAHPGAAFGAPEYPLQAEFPSTIALGGAYYTHLSAEGYYMLGQQQGQQLFNLLTGQTRPPILIGSVRQSSATQLLVDFSGAPAGLVDDPHIYSGANNLTPPPNMGFGVYNTAGITFSAFSVTQASLVGPSTVALDFSGALSGVFRLYLGRTENDLLTTAGGGLGGFGGSTLRDARTTAALAPSGGQPLTDPVVYNYAPIQYVTVAAGALTVSAAAWLIANSASAIVEPGVYVADSGVLLAQLTGAQIASLAALGVSRVQVTNYNWAMTAAQAVAFETFGWTVSRPSTVAVLLADQAAAIAALTPQQIAGLAGLSVARVSVLGGGAVFSAAQAAAFEAAALSAIPPTGSFNAVADTAAGLQALTPAQITGLGALRVASVTATDTGPSFSAAQAAALVAAKVSLRLPAGAFVTLSDTAANLGSLTAAQIASLIALGVRTLAASDAGLTLGAVNALALAAAGVAFVVPPGAGVIVADNGVNLGKLTPDQFAALARAGVAGVRITGFNWTMSAAQAVALESLGWSPQRPATVVVSLVDQAAAIAALTPRQIAGLTGLGVSRVSPIGGGATLSAAQAAAFEAASLPPIPPAGSFNAVADTAASLAGLTPAQIAGLGALKVASVTATDAGPSLTAAQAAALTAAKVSLRLPAGAFVSLADTASNLASLTAAQIVSLIALGVRSLVAADAGLTLGAANAVALAGAGVALIVPPGSPVVVADNAINLGKLTPAQIAALAQAGVSALQVTAYNWALNAAQALAFEALGWSLGHPAGVAISLSDQAAAVAALTRQQISGLANVGVSRVSLLGGGAVISGAQAAAFEAAALTPVPPAGSFNALSDTAAGLAGLTPAQIAGFGALKVTTVTLTDAGPVLSSAQALALASAKAALRAPAGASVAITDTAANLASLSAAQIASLAALGVRSLAATDAGLTLGAASAVALAAAGVALSVPAGAAITVADSAANLARLTPVQIAALASEGVGALYDLSGALSFSPAQTAALLAAPLSVGSAAGLTVTETFADGGYLAYKGGVLTAQKRVNADGSYAIAHFNATGLGYSTYVDLYSSASALLAEARDLSASDGVLQLYAAGLTVTKGSGSLTVAAGTSGFTLTPHPNETIAANRKTGETYSFLDGFGTSAISGYTLTGAAHDIFGLPAGSFADAAQLFASGAQSGADVIFTDGVANSLTLNGTTLAALQASAGDFRFV